MLANDAGRMVARWCAELAVKFPHAVPDESGVMPNHFHAIVLLWPDAKGARLSADERSREPLPEIVQWFKTMTTNEYIAGVKTHGWPEFRGRLWQRDYHEHVVRDKEDVNEFRRYIRENPANWATDEENLIALKIDPRWGGGIRPRPQP